MSKKKPKYYVVWVGKQPGVYNTWPEAQQQIEGFAGARYKSYESLPLAQQAFRIGPIAAAELLHEMPMEQRLEGLNVPPPEENAIAVDAACSGNPGVMEYQGVYVATRTPLFHFKAPVGTNNIGEFLAIVHGLAYMQKNHLEHLTLYSDSVNALNWVRKKECRTKLPVTPQTEKLYNVIRRAEAWLHNNSYKTQIKKWDTDHWGEIPADFGRK